MRFSFQPIKGFTLYLYLIAVPLLLLSWLNIQLEWFLVNEKLSLQVFILSIILIAFAAIINLSLYLFMMARPDLKPLNTKKDLSSPDNKNNPSGDH